MTTSRLPYRANHARASQPSTSTQRLPGFDELISLVGRPCPRCHLIPENNGSTHECYLVSEGPTSSTSAGRVYSNAQHESVSAAAHTPSELPTPVSSRSPSISGSADGGYASSFESPDERICATCHFQCSVPEHVKREKKKGKEQHARGDQAQVLQDAEDMMNCFFDWKPAKVQSSGNGSAAGIETPKIDLLRGMLYFSRAHLEVGYKKAIIEGREEQWKAEKRREMTSFLAGFQASEEHSLFRDPSLAGSWMDQPDEQPCRKRSGSKQCRTHPGRAPDHVQCRKRRRMATFKENENKFKRSCGRA